MASCPVFARSQRTHSRLKVTDIDAMAHSKALARNTELEFTLFTLTSVDFLQIGRPIGRDMGKGILTHPTRGSGERSVWEERSGALYDIDWCYYIEL